MSEIGEQQQQGCEQRIAVGRMEEDDDERWQPRSVITTTTIIIDICSEFKRNDKHQRHRRRRRNGRMSGDVTSGKQENYVSWEEDIDGRADDEVVVVFVVT